MNKKLIAAIGFMFAFCIGIFFYAEWQKQKFDASLPEPPAPTQVRAETETDDRHTEAGHWHGDEWHTTPHTAVDAIANPQESVQDEGDLIPLDFTENVPEMQESPTYVLPPGTSREDAIRVNEAYKKWQREVWQPAHDEWYQLAMQPATFFSSIDEDFRRKLNNMSDKERAELAEKVLAPHKKSAAAYKRLMAIERNKPDFVAEVLGGK